METNTHTILKRGREAGGMINLNIETERTIGEGYKIIIVVLVFLLLFYVKFVKPRCLFDIYMEQTNIVVRKAVMVEEYKETLNSLMATFT